MSPLWWTTTGLSGAKYATLGTANIPYRANISGYRAPSIQGIGGCLNGRPETIDRSVATARSERGDER